MAERHFQKNMTTSKNEVNRGPLRILASFVCSALLASFGGGTRAPLELRGFAQMPLTTEGDPLDTHHGGAMSEPDEGIRRGPTPSLGIRKVPLTSHEGLTRHEGILRGLTRHTGGGTSDFLRAVNQ